MLKEKHTIIKKSIEIGKEFHKRAFKYFSIFINFLHNENIMYYLCGGTLLGCIRDNERIPWDDDYDIYMRRKHMKSLEKYSIELSKVKHLHLLENITQNAIIYYLKINNCYFIISKTNGRFNKLWATKDGEKSKNLIFIADIFNESDVWYGNIRGFYSTIPIKYPFHNLMCNVSKSFNKELTYYYGKNYMNEYVVYNHSNKNSRENKKIILTKEEYKEISLSFNDY